MATAMHENDKGDEMGKDIAKKKVMEMKMKLKTIETNLDSDLTILYKQNGIKPGLKDIGLTQLD